MLDLIGVLDISVEDLRADLFAEQQEGRGAFIETLSPFGAVVQTLLWRREGAMRAMLTGRPVLTDRRTRFRLVIPAEIELPGSIKRPDCRNAIFIDD